MIFGRRIIAAALAGTIAGLGSAAAADEPEAPRDVDAWHAALSEAIGGEIGDEPALRWSLGLYPNFGLALGPPEWITYQIQGYVSLSNGSSFSLFTGYGYERGWGAEAHLVTLGWGGVRRLSGTRPQRGFYGKFIRYRRINDFSHGVLHGLSVGAETGAGLFSFAFEFGAARSARNHWAVTAQIGVKIAFPVIIQLSRKSGS